jgi:hypothetical protein
LPAQPAWPCRARDESPKGRDAQRLDAQRDSSAREAGAPHTQVDRLDYVDDDERPYSSRLRLLRICSDPQWRIVDARLSAARAVNRELVAVYWDIGQSIQNAIRDALSDKS